MTISGGGSWQPLASRAGSGWPGTEIWYREATASEPDTYSVSQHSSASGVVFVAALKDTNGADISVQQADGTTCTAANPSSASGLELRFVCGVPPGQDFISWTAPSGYTVVQRRASPWTSACLAVKSFSSRSEE